MKATTETVVQILKQVDYEPAVEKWLKDNADAVQDSLIEVLTGKVTDIDDYMRKNAISFLGIVGDDLAVPVLAEYADHRNELFSINAIRALGNIPTKASGDALAKKLQDKKINPTIGKIALQSIQKTGQKIPAKVSESFRKLYAEKKKGSAQLKKNVGQVEELLNKVTNK